MTALFANSHSMQLSAALGNIGKLKNSVADMMQHRYFTDVVHTQGEVAGSWSRRARLRHISSHRG